MNGMNELNLETKEIWVQGLLIHCPMGKALDTCHAKELRKIPLQERLALVKQMEETQLDAIIDLHKRCLSEREG